MKKKKNQLCNQVQRCTHVSLPSIYRICRFCEKERDLRKLNAGKLMKELNPLSHIRGQWIWQEN